MIRLSIVTMLVVAVGAARAAESIKTFHTEAHGKLVAGWVEKNAGELVEMYKHLHANPEISLGELKTAALMAKAFKKSGFEVTSGVGRTGVVGVMRNGEGPTVLIRGDMDGLPVIEETGVPYASRVKIKKPDGTTVGAMHACGHDVHITMALGTARLLADMRDEWSGTLVMIGQPAEEIGRGAKLMIDDGLFERFPVPDYCLSIHVSHDVPVGHLGYTSGWAAANVDSVDITIFGKGGHGARPHSSVDPIVTAAQVITSLQTLVSRRVNPIEPGVVTVGSIHGGTKHNIIPNEVKMQLTVRSYSDDVRKLLLDGIRQITVDTCRVMGCPKEPIVEIDENEYTPAGYNDPELTAAAVEIFKDVMGEEMLIEKPAQMGGEDFGRYSKHLGVPGLQYRVGTVSMEDYKASLEPGGGSLPSLHSSLFAPVPEPSVTLAVESMGNLALALLQRGE